MQAGTAGQVGRPGPQAYWELEDSGIAGDGDGSKDHDQ